MKCQNNSFLGWIWSWAHPPLQDWCLWCCVGEGSSGRRTWVLPPGGGQRYGSWRPTLEPGTRSAWAPWGRCQPPGRGHREASSQCSGNTPTEPEPGRPAEDEDRGTRDEKRGRWREGGGVRREGGGEREEGWEEREEERGRREEGKGGTKGECADKVWFRRKQVRVGWWRMRMDRKTMKGKRREHFVQQV